MHPTSAEGRPEWPNARSNVEDARQLPLGLGFADRKLEAEWWRQYARERHRLLRGNIALLYGMWLCFWPVDVFVFSDHTRALLTARGVLLVFFAAAAPLVFGKRSSEMLERHAQEILLYLTVVGVTSLFTMAWFVLGTTDKSLVMVALTAGLFTLVCIYCTSGLRFAYAAPIGGLGAAVFYVMMIARAHPSNDLRVVATAFIVGESTVCAVICYSLEAMGRRDFLRRRELEGAHARTEALLLNLMPRSLADRLKAGSGAMLDRLPDATVLFATLVGFEDATRSLAPLDAVRLLDRVVASFDRAARAEGVERIKTVGATYMAAAGVPVAQADHAQRAARLCLVMREIVRQMVRDEGLSLSLRVGVASGPVVAGVIGKTRIAFDCWGDTANLASRLDSHGKADRIQLGPSAALALGESFVVEPVGMISVKGKGEVSVAFLEGAR
jgi:class 3 adenylate cyclase